MKEIIEKKYKIITIIFVTLGLYLILKLWLVGFYSYCGSSGFISLCIVPSVKYYWISSGYIAILLFIVSLFILYRMKKVNSKLIKVGLSILILFMGIIGKQIFYVISPDFKFYLNKAEYKDKDNNLVDIDKYLELVTKYCIDDNKFKFYHSRETMCSGKFEPELKTVDEYIKVFEAAKNSNFEYLYYLTFRFADKNVGLENIIEKYNDDTFYAYVVNTSSDLNILKLVYKNVNNEQLKVLIKNNIDSIEYFDLNQDNMTQDVKDHYSEKVYKNYFDGIKQIPEINNKIF